MKQVAVRQRDCQLVAAGTAVWVHGGNALIEFGSVKGFNTLLYYPAAAL